MDTLTTFVLRSAGQIRVNPVAILWAAVLLLTAANPALAFDDRSRLVEDAVRNALPPPSKVRTAGHEWKYELEQSGIWDRNRPRRYRLALPLMQLGDNGPTLAATYAKPPGGTDRNWMLFVHVPLD